MGEDQLDRIRRTIQDVRIEAEAASHKAATHDAMVRGTHTPPEDRSHHRAEADKALSYRDGLRAAADSIEATIERGT